MAATNNTGDDTPDSATVIYRQRKRHVSGDSLKDRRRHSQTLTPLVIPDGDSMLSGLTIRGTRQTSREDVKEESKELFEHFVYDEIQKERIELPEDFTAESNISTPIGYDNPAWAKYGRELRVMADEFAKTKERQKIKEQAGEVDMSALTYDRFSDMCSELFCPGNNDGITQERLMVLFFFCSDMAIRTLRQKAVKLFKQFLNWSVQFFTDRVSVWVEQRGGWAAVLGKSGRFITEVMAVAAVICAVFVVGKFIMNRFSSSS